jgi:TRAP-type mannitol/chloroaromatic compound transport system permease small subunit
MQIGQKGSENLAVSTKFGWKKKIKKTLISTIFFFHPFFLVLEIFKTYKFQKTSFNASLLGSGLNNFQFETVIQVTTTTYET